jgi:hypothetical protein
VFFFYKEVEYKRHTKNMEYPNSTQYTQTGKALSETKKVIQNSTWHVLRWYLAYYCNPDGSCINGEAAEKKKKSNARPPTDHTWSPFEHCVHVRPGGSRDQAAESGNSSTSLAGITSPPPGPSYSPVLPRTAARQQAASSSSKACFVVLAVLVSLQ